MSELIPDPLEPDQVVDPVEVDGSGAGRIPPMFEPVDDWSEVDPEFEDLPAPGADDEDGPDEDEELTDDEAEPLEDAAELFPFWVQYELYGRNLDEGTAWARLAVEDFDGSLEVEAEGLTAGARWEFRIRLIDRDGRHSKWSEPLQITLPTDFTPPPAPTEPIIRDVRGYTAVGWDGLLQGPIPADMSHVQLYVQQQHPEGDPDGEPGDPRRITTMPSAGEHPLLQFLANVLHKAWFTAVDTTGNESPWSPQVEFTPTPPVDVEAIEQELQDARDRLEAAEAKAADAMQRVTDLGVQWDEADFPQLKVDLEQAQQAVADAEVRLDAAEQGVADSQAGLIDLRDNRLPALRGDLDSIESAVADYDQRIQQAQAGADQANATADHLEGTVLPALDDRLTDNEQALEAAEGTLDQTRLGMENLRDVRLPDLDDRLRGGILEVADSYQRLAVTDATNHIHDPDFWELPDDGIVPSQSLGVAAWMRPSGNSPTWESWTSSGRRFMRILDPGDATLRRIGYFGAGGRGFRVEPGDEMRFTCRAHRDNPGGGSDRIQIRGRYMDIHGVEIGGWQNIVDIRDGGVREYEGEFTVPADDSIRYMYLDFIAWYSTGMTGNAWIEKPMLRRKNGGELLVDGSISARHIMAEEIAGAVGQFLNLTADQIDTENLAAYLATIIELDAGQITSGKINTSRLDAEEVAGAVANFLTLDALEINVEQLAGEIANIIEITAESIASGAISTRHLAIADFENLMPEEAIWDFRDEGLSSPLWSASAQGASGWRTLVNQHSRLPVALRIDSTGDLSGTSRLDFRFGGKGIAVKPGESLRLSGYGWRSTVGGGNVGVRFRWANEEGNQVSFGSNGPHRFESGWAEFSLEETVPNNDTIRYLTLDFYAQPGAPSGHWGDFSLRRMTGGELIVDGSIRARHIIAEEIAGAVAQFLELHASQITAGTIDTNRLNVSDLAAQIATVIQLNASRITAGTLNANRINIASLFANSAFINSLAARVVETLQVTAERGFIGGALLEDSTITVEKLYALDEIMSELARFLRIEAGSLASNDIESMRIVSSLIEASVYLIHDANGDVSVRLDGMNNFFRGALHAGVGADSEIHLDYGSKTRRRGLDQEGEPNTTWSVQTPYMDFRDERYNYRSDLRPSIHLDEGAPGESGEYDGMMVINPGYREDTPIYRGRLNVVGDVHANRLYSREWMETNRGFSMANSNSNLTTSLSQNPSGNTHLLGRHSGAHHSRQRDSFWQSDTYSLQAGARRVRSFTWGTVPPSGLRRPVLSAHSLTNGAMIAVNSHSLTSTGYSINEENIGPSQTSYYVHQIAIWV